MKSLKIISLLCFLTLIIFVNVKGNRGKTTMQSDAMEIGDVPRVKIKVFRGSNKEQNGEQFSTWGFWIKQPATMK